MNKISIAGLLLISLSANFTLQAQEIIRCATVEYSAEKRKDNPQLKQSEDEMNKVIWQSMQETSKGIRGQTSVSTVVTIPVVVHVVYNTAAQNISYAQIASQITVMNQDFSKTNTDIGSVPAIWAPLAANTQIQFCLAQRKPNGDWTDGIERRQTTKTSYETGGIDSVKFYSLGGLDAWDYTRYLNIWVLNFAGGVLGITQMPLTGPASTDGICVQYNAFGKGAFPLLTNYNRGRTATHEIGHWLGLYHIWGDDNGYCYGSDSISDTPNQTEENYSYWSPGTVRTDSCSPVSPGFMWMNYMDYTVDRSMYMFTQEQSVRMNLVLSNIRNSILTSDGCVPSIGIEETELENFISIYPNPSDNMITLQMDFPVPQNLSASLFDSMGRLVFAKDINQAMNDKLLIPLSELKNGLYYFRFLIEGKSVCKKIIISH